MPSTAKPVVFTGGRILTMDPRHSYPDIVVVEDGRIAAIGERALLSKYAGAEVYDLGGRTLTPGFIDAHNHLCIAALHPLWADLSRVGTEADLERALRRQAEREPEAAWIRGAGWNEVETGLLPDRRLLDSFGFDRPVLLAHYSLHQCVVDSRGLDILGIGRATSDPAGGVIVHDGNGDPSGLLVERAWSQAHARSLAGYCDPERWGDLICARARILLAEGITCVHDAACPPAAEAVYRNLARADALPLSVLVMPHAEDILTAPPAARLDGPPTGEGDERLRVGPLKYFADGGIAPAVDVSIGGQRTSFGIGFDDVVEQVCHGVERGFRAAVHAIGNAGLAAALEGFERAARSRPSADHRFRVEHACLASREQIRQMADLGIVGVVQPGFVHHVGKAVENVVLDHEIWLPFGDMARAGIPLAASSDDPCAFWEPLRTSSHGATRLTASGNVLAAEQAVSYEEWLWAYTMGAAYAGGQEGERGSLSPGKRADLVVLEGDLDPTNPPRVAETWVEGKRVFFPLPAPVTARFP